MITEGQTCAAIFPEDNNWHRVLLHEFRMKATSRFDLSTVSVIFPKNIQKKFSLSAFLLLRITITGKV